MNKKTLHFGLGRIALLLMLVACSSSTVSMRPVWITRWLKDPICQPPCWENISPGKTSLEEAKSIVNSHPDMKISYIDDVSISIRNKSEEENFGLLTAPNGQTIQRISLLTRQFSLELSEIVNLYGFPNEMLVFDSSQDQFSVRWIDLLYYKHGMVVTYYPPPDKDHGNEITLAPDTKIRGIGFYALQLENYFNSSQWLGSTVSTPTNISNGYGTYRLQYPQSP
jgi:hypothetical protein